MSQSSSSFSRRSFLQVSSMASAALAFRIVNEPMLALAAAPAHPPGSILINANENPLGPCAAARSAIAEVTPHSGRYLMEPTNALEKQFAQSLGLTDEQVSIFAGSTPPLVFTVRACCSPSASYVTADPGFEAGLMACQQAKARAVKVPLTKAYAHDVKAMIAAAPDAGLFYICNPNNPTGTLTSHSDIEYLVENKPKNSIVMVDEAYIHFSDAPTAIDLVKAGKDVIVLRTFSKIYGMAGLRCGFAIARPDLLEKIHNYGGYNFHAGNGGGCGLGEFERLQPCRRSQTHQRPGTRGHFPVARRQRLLLHPLAGKLLPARHQASGKRTDRRHGKAGSRHRPRLAGHAESRAGHDRNESGDGCVSDCAEEGDERHGCRLNRISTK